MIPARILSDLISIPSVNPNYDPSSSGEAAIASYVEEHCSRLGLDVWRQDCLPGRQNILAELRVPGATRRLLLESHMDTVSLSPMDERALVADLRDGRIYGRGACDDKGSLAAMLAAMEQLIARRRELKANVLLLAAVDEEYRFRGVLSYIDDPLPTHAAVVGEPTGLRIVVAHKGTVRIRIRTLGRAAHSSTPWEGSNAIEAMVPILIALEQYRDGLNARRHPLVGEPTLNIGLIAGGISVHIVPPGCVIELDRRYIPGETPDTVLAEIDALLAQVKQQHPDLLVDREEPFTITPTLNTPPDSDIVRCAQSACRSLGLLEEPCGVTYGSDASKLQAYGNIPSIVFGPGSIAQAHTADEFVPIEQLCQAADVYARIALAFE